MEDLDAYKHELMDLYSVTANTRIKNNLENRDRIVMNKVSTIPLKTGASCEPAHVAHEIGRADSALRNFIGMFANDKGPCLPALYEERFSSPDGQAAMLAIDKVLTHSFEPTQTADSARRKFQLPTMAVVNKMLRTCPPHGKVLCLGASEAMASA
jgi:hypothetical protein